MLKEELTIGEVAARAGVATSALRHYETIGLITSTRTSGRHRRFARSVLRRIAVIQAAQHVGVSLAEIKEAFDRFSPEHAPTKQDWARLAREWRPRLDERIRALQQVRDGLSQCVGCGCLSMRQCAIYNPQDALSSHGAGARRVFPRSRDEPSRQ